MQSKKHSFIEACTDVFSGMMLAFGISQIGQIYESEIQQYIWEDFKWQISIQSNILMTIVLTVVSLARKYIWRRIFNMRSKKQ